MAYISNTTQNNKVKWGLPSSSGPLFPSPSFKTAQSTPMYGGSGSLQKTINDATGGVSGPQTPLQNEAPAYKGTTSVVQNPTTSTSTLPYGQNTGDNTTPLRSNLASLYSGLQSLSKALGSSNNQPSQPTKGLLPAPQPSQFSQFTGALYQAGAPSKDQRDYLRKVEQAAVRGREVADEARDISRMYGREIARVGNLGAGAVAGAKSTGTDVVGRGNAAIAAESASNRIGALSAAQAAALQGTGQQLTAAEQGITGFTNALQGANTQQQLAQQALQAGGQLALPSPAAFGQTVFNPVTGAFEGVGGNLDPQLQAQNFAQQVMSGNMTYDQALASLGYAGNAGTNFLNNAIVAAGGNPLQLQAQAAGQQANISTQTTAGTDIARQGLQQATQDYINTNTAAQFAHDQARAVTEILGATGLNNVSSTDYNRALNELKGRFSDVNFTALNTALTEAQVAYTNLLSTGGGTPSGREAQALGTLNINNSAAAINASIQELENAVARRLQAQYGALQQYNQNLGSGNTIGGAPTGSGSIWDW